MSQSLFDKYGKNEFCKNVVGYFYDELMLKDPVTRKYFASTDMSKQKIMQEQFVAFALGGPVKYTGRDMKIAHTGLGITENVYDLTVSYLGKALKKFGMVDEHITAVALKLGGLKKDIVEIPNEPVKKCCF